MASADDSLSRTLVTTRAFERDVKRLAKRGLDLDLLWTLAEALRTGQQLAARHRDHPLSGELKGFRDCHIQPDWVLIYAIDESTVYLTRTGSHSDLFG
jgi:mRNA interferase YafQ